MTDVLSPAQINEWLMGVSRQLGTDLAEARQAAVDYARADRAYKQSWTAAYERSEGAVKTREVFADASTLDEREALKASEGVLRVADLAVRSRMAQLSAFQSVATSVREEHRFGRVGPEEHP